MSTAVTIGKVLWKSTRITLKLLLTIISALLEIASDSKEPVCGAAEAHARRERGTITPDEFYKATNRY